MPNIFKASCLSYINLPSKKSPKYLPPTLEKSHVIFKYRPCIFKYYPSLEKSLNNDRPKQPGIQNIFFSNGGCNSGDKAGDRGGGNYLFICYKHIINIIIKQIYKLDNCFTLFSFPFFCAFLFVFVFCLVL